MLVQTYQYPSGSENMLCCDSQSQWLSSMWRGECQCRLATNHHFDWLFGCIGLACLPQDFHRQACRCGLETFAIEDADSMAG